MLREAGVGVPALGQMDGRLTERFRGSRAQTAGLRGPCGAGHKPGGPSVKAHGHLDPWTLPSRGALWSLPGGEAEGPRRGAGDVFRGWARLCLVAAEAGPGHCIAPKHSSGHTQG